MALRIAWRTLVLSGVTGPEQVGRLEEIMLAEREKPYVFATLTSLSVPAGAQQVRLTRAGHPGMLLRTAEGGVEWVEVAGGPALGVAPGAPLWPVEETALPAGSALVLFTDGLFEGHTGNGRERLGEEGPASAWHCARRSSSITAATSGSTAATPGERASASPCRPTPTPTPTLTLTPKPRRTPCPAPRKRP